MVKIISMFNNKGGVSKTTTSMNLGWMLAQKGYRTLLVDADPQSNLTSLTLSLSDDDDARELFYQKRDSNDIWRLASNYKQPNPEIAGEIANIISTAQDNLFILPGYIQIEEFSTTITLALELGGSKQFEYLAKVPGYLNYALRRIADIHKLDYIIVDMAPSLSGLNEVLLMGSDFFIAPCRPDFFSEIAIKNLATIIPDWHKTVSNFKTDYPLPCKPVFLGLIQQNYRPRRVNEDDDKNKPAKSFQKWIDRIRTTTNSILIPELKKLDIVISEEKFKAAVQNAIPYDLAYISDFNSLVAAAQDFNKPIFTLTQEELKKYTNLFGHALRTANENVEKFQETFSSLADSVIGLTQ
ncbi:MAG: AAA family ATPase [Alphaproteobacteria bacterium]|nr:AAA family ATPase [Alphaproteobacteria bacterium]